MHSYFNFMSIFEIGRSNRLEVSPFWPETIYQGWQREGESKYWRQRKRRSWTAKKEEGVEWISLV
jgi:hypothetical protein